MLGHQYPWLRVLYDKDLPLVWLPQILSCSFSNSGSTVSRWTQSKYGPKNERLYSFYSLENQYCGAFLWIFSTSFLSLGSVPYLNNKTSRSIQLKPTCMLYTLTMAWSWQLGATKSSTTMIQGRPCPDEVANMANESAWEFLLLGICFMEKASKLDCNRLILLRYLCIRWSLASKSPLICSTTNLKFEKISTALPPNLLTIIIPASKASYSASLFVAGKLNLKDLSLVIFSGDTNSTPDPFWLAALIGINFSWWGVGNGDYQNFRA